MLFFSRKKKVKFNYVFVYSQLPFISKKIIKQSFEKLKRGNFDFVFGAIKIDTKFLRTY